MMDELPLGLAELLALPTDVRLEPWGDDDHPLLQMLMGDAAMTGGSTCSRAARQAAG